MGLLPLRGGEAWACQQVGLICLHGRDKAAAANPGLESLEVWFTTRRLSLGEGTAEEKAVRLLGWGPTGSPMGKPVFSGKTSPGLKCDILFLKRSQGSRFFPSMSSFLYFYYLLVFFFFFNSVRTPSVHWVTTSQSLSQRHIKWYSSFFLFCFVVFRFLIWNPMLFFQILFLYSPPLCTRSWVCVSF